MIWQQWHWNTSKSEESSLFRHVAKKSARISISFEIRADPHYGVVVTGFEPVTSALSRRRSKPTELNDLQSFWSWDHLRQKASVIGERKGIYFINSTKIKGDYVFHNSAHRASF